MEHIKGYAVFNESLNTENINESKGQALADKYVAKLRQEFKKLNDDELAEFRATIAQAFDLNEGVNEAEFKHINKSEHKIKLAIKDVEKKSRLKINRDKEPEYEQLSLNKIMLSKVLGRERLGKEHQAAWEKLKKEYELKESVNERFKHNDMYAMLDIAAQYSSTQHQAANQMWSDEQDLYDYLKSDHIPKKYHKDFYNDVKSRFKGVTESVNEAIEKHKDASKELKNQKISEVYYEMGTYYVELSNGKYISFDVGGMQPTIGKVKDLDLNESVNEAMDNYISSSDGKTFTIHDKNKKKIKDVSKEELVNKHMKGQPNMDDFMEKFDKTTGKGKHWKYWKGKLILVSIKESVNEGKSYQEKFKEESDHYQEMINDPKKRVYDIVDFAQFTTGGMTQAQWEMFMDGRYKKFKDNTDKPTKEKMYKVLTKWLGK